MAISVKARGANHPDVGNSLNNIASLLRMQDHDPEAELLYRASLVIFEKALGPDHRALTGSLNNLAGLYADQSRYADALPLIARTIDAKRPERLVALPVLLGSEEANLISVEESFSASYKTLQLTSSSEAADAVAKLAQRFAAGTNDLSALVRSEQDLAAEHGAMVEFR